MMLPKLRSPVYFKNIPPVYYIERDTERLCRELIPAEQWLKWLYYTPFGNMTLESVVKRRTFSGFYGRYMNTAISTQKIKPFIDMFEVDLTEYEKENVAEYRSFNEFFIRKIKKGLRPINNEDKVIISPADGKLLAYANIEKDLHFVVKGYDFSIAEFLNNEELAEEYSCGSLIIIRLAPSDYHRFHFPIDGIPEKTRIIKGRYYSVSPLSIRKKFKTFYQNKREYTILKSELFDNVVMAEIGATLVGCIKQTYAPFNSVKKGDEKGYFEFGGSSVILLFKKGMITIDPDLLQNSHLSYETKVKMGERIAILSQN